MASSQQHFHPPSSYEDGLSYGQQWSQLKQSQQPHCVVHSLMWHGNRLLAACSNTGELCFWNLPPEKDHSEDSSSDISSDKMISLIESGEMRMSNQQERDEESLTIEPMVRVKMSDNSPLFSIQKASFQDKQVLLVCGQEMVSVYSWDQIVPVAPDKDNQESANEKQLVQLHSAQPPIAVFRTHPSPFQTPVKVHEVQVGTSSGQLFGATSDTFGCYKWDIETQKLLTTYHHSSPVGSIQLLAGETSLLTGTTAAGSGSLGIWDCRTDKLMEQLGLPDTIQQPQGSSPSSAKQGRKEPFISSLLANDTWWMAAGGFSPKRSGGGGFLATWHGPTRSLVASTITRETPQQLALYQQQSLLSVANEGVVSHWNPMTLELRQRVWSSPPSGYALAVADDGRIAVGGVGHSIDIFEGTPHAPMRFRIHV